MIHRENQGVSGVIAPRRAFFDKVLRNTPFGLLLGALMALCLAAGLDQAVYDRIAQFYAYIFGALITLCAAGFALVGVFYNIESQRVSAREHQRRKLLAVRAFFPMALSKFHRLCRKGIFYSNRFDELHAEMGMEFHQISLRALEVEEADVLSVFRGLIELTDDDGLAQRLALLMREYQIALSRWRSNFDDPNLLHTEYSNRSRTAYWAYLGAIIESMFDYARGNEQVLSDPDIEPLIQRNLWQGDDALFATDAFSAEIGAYARLYESRMAVGFERAV